MDLISTPAEPPARLIAGATRDVRSNGLWRVLEAALLVLAAIFFGLHFVHLKADFPNHSPWMDWAKYTDEGWYGDAAIRHYELGHWNVPGDFNPAAALPVWPVLELALFRFSGVSLAAARALTVTVFGLILVLCYLLVRRWGGLGRGAVAQRRSLAPAMAVTLLAVSPFCFVFSRLAILEPLLILLTLAALLAASAAGRAGAPMLIQSQEAKARRERMRPVMSSAGLGVLLTLMVLDKTTGLFLFPAIFWMLWACGEYRLRPLLRAAAIACGTAIATWGAYYLLFVRPHYLADYRYLFSANAYTGITLATFWPVLHDAVMDISWIGGTLFVLALIAVAASIARVAVQGLRANPLMIALLLWIFGYGAFLAYHANLQPRYYLVIAVPLILLTAMVFDWLLMRATERRVAAGCADWTIRIAGLAVALVLLFAAVHGGMQTLGYVAHPQYEWWNAAQQVRGVVEREALASQAKGGVAHSRLMFSISGSDLSLMTGLPSICDDFGTMILAERVATYRPGWFVAWNDVEDDKMEALAPLFRLERVAAIPAFDDPDRNLLIVYRLDPLASPGARGGVGRRRFLSMPHRLRTKIGE